MFKLGGEQESLAVLFKDDYLQLVRRRCSSSLVIQKFLSTIVEKINEISIEKSALLKAGFTEDDIKYSKSHFFTFFEILFQRLLLNFIQVLGARMPFDCQNCLHLLVLLSWCWRVYEVLR